MDDGELTARKRLADIAAEIRASGNLEWDRRAELNTEAHDLRQFLKQVAASDLDAASKSWGDRAGRKGTHEVDYETAQAVARAYNPPEGGYGG